MAYTYFESYLLEFKTQNVNNLCLLVKLVPESAQMHVCHRSASCLVRLLETEAIRGFGRRMDWSYGLCLLQASTFTTLHPEVESWFSLHRHRY